MFGDLNPLLTGVVVFAVLAASIVIVVSLALSHRSTHPRQPVTPLPSGADAALWSIVEAVPDPRNHLALTRDLSGEVHITSADRDAAAALYAERPKTQRIAAPAASRPVAADTGSVKTRPVASPPSWNVETPSAAAAPQAEVAAERPVARHAPAAEPKAETKDEPSETIAIVARDDHEPEPESEADKLVRTSEFFFAGEPRLNRF